MKCTWSDTCNFFWNFISKKIASVGSEHHFYPTLVIFFWIENFFISKKITSVGSSAFPKKSQVSDQLTLVIFLTFFEKNYNDWIKGDSAKSKTKWTGLKSEEICDNESLGTTEIVKLGLTDFSSFVKCKSPLFQSCILQTG